MKQTRFDQKHVEQQITSGLSAKEYCQQKGINYHTLKYWQAKRRIKTNIATSGFVAISAAESKEEWFLQLSNRGIQIKLNFDWKFPDA